ncbi:phosphoadenosine phosphosulfate reductase family protein [candidate division WOR-3 bacterium]|nr:phosphoadenosine phosphosulfate reductase family protein [candidate division WOR-3 bacterium]
MSSSPKNSRWWTPVEEAFAGTKVEGLKVRCPMCGEWGTVITRWVKGPTVKPLYILHIKWGKVRKVCELEQEQANEVRTQVTLKKNDVKHLLETRESFVLFSGGKDSLATLYYLRDLARSVGREVTALFIDTTAGLPETKKYAKKVCKYLGVNLEIAKPEKDFFTLAKEWGIPSFGKRWCCRELKIKPVADFLAKIQKPKVIFDGIRAAESFIRSQYIPIWYHPSFNCLSVSPIFDWSDEEVYSFIYSNGIPKTILHSIGTSTECWCGAYKTETDFKKLYDLDKDMFHKLEKLEGEIKTGYTFLFNKRTRKKKPLKVLEKEIREEKMNGKKKS